MIHDYGSGGRTKWTVTDIGLVDTDPRWGFQQQLEFHGPTAFIKQVLEADQAVEGKALYPHVHEGRENIPWKWW